VQEQGRKKGGGRRKREGKEGKEGKRVEDPIAFVRCRRLTFARISIRKPSWRTGSEEGKRGERKGEKKGGKRRGRMMQPSFSLEGPEMISPVPSTRRVWIKSQVGGWENREGKS